MTSKSLPVASVSELEGKTASRGATGGPSVGIEDFFYGPAGRVADFFRAQLHLYRRDVRLQDYFMMLQLATADHPPSLSPHRRQISSSMMDWSIRAADKVSRPAQPKTIKTDVLYCPMANFSRKTENRFLVRSLLALAETDAKIVCLLPPTAPCRQEAETRLQALGRKGQVTFLDPLGSRGSVEARLRSQVARMRGRAALQTTMDILAPHGLAPGPGLADQFNHIALYVEAWKRLAPSIDFDAVVARCHWHVLCSPVCRTGMERKKQVITFQQGIIGHSLDAPVTASKYVAFGPTSAAFLNRLNGAFFQAAEMPQPHTEYVSGGCLYDTILPLPDQFDRQTLLMVDVPQPSGQGDFYGVEGHAQSLLALAAKLLATRPSLRLIIRPHPYWGNLDLDACQHLARKYPFRCELSHPAWSLDDDLRRSSVAIGIFSGALTVASASGLPSIFLRPEQSYGTGDLACFAEGQTLTPEAAFDKISDILASPHAYAEARSEALHNARGCYERGSNLDLNGAFFERLLRKETA